MKFVCTRCQAVLTVPDVTAAERDLRGLKCAVCAGPMTAEREDAVHGGNAVSQLQLLASGTTRMLLCMADAAGADRVVEAVNGLGWDVVVASSPALALHQLEDTHFEVVLMEERFGVAVTEGNPVLQHMQRLPMGMRRAVLLCLISEGIPSLDYMAAFRAGVDLIVNKLDIDKLQNVLRHLLRQHQASYSCFDQEFRDRGTASG